MRLAFLLLLCVAGVFAGCVWSEVSWTDDEAVQVLRQLRNRGIPDWHFYDMINDLRTARRIDEIDAVLARWQLLESPAQKSLCIYEVFVWLRDTFPGEYQRDALNRCMVVPLRGLIQSKASGDEIADIGVFMSDMRQAQLCELDMTPYDELYFDSVNTCWMCTWCSHPMLFSHLVQFPSKTVPENSSAEHRLFFFIFYFSVLWNCSPERFWKEIHPGGKITWGDPMLFSHLVHFPSKMVPENSFRRTHGLFFIFLFFLFFLFSGTVLRNGFGRKFTQVGK